MNPYSQGPPRRPGGGGPSRPPLPPPDPSTIVAGPHPVTEALRAGRELEKILLAREADAGRLTDLLDFARRRRVPVQRVPGAALDRYARVHQGVVAFVSALVYQKLSAVMRDVQERGEEPLIIMLDGVTDVRNAGAIARTAECAGAHALVVPMLGTALLGADALKASAGALEHLPVCREARLDKAIAWLHGQGIRTLALTEKAELSLFEATLSGPMALVVGAEGAGVSPEVLAAVQTQAFIPMGGRVGSLNVSAAAAVGLYQIVQYRLSQG